MERTVTIPAENLNKLVRDFESLNRRVRRHGGVPVRLTVQDAPVAAPTRTVTVTGTGLRLGEWETVALVERLEGEVLSRSFGSETIPARFREARMDGVCEHCGTSRNRKQVFILRSGTTYRQVGSSCLGDFTGARSVDGLIALAQALSEVSALLDGATDPGFGGFGGGNILHLDRYLPYVVAEVNKYGYISKAAAEESGYQTTAESAYEAMVNDKPGRTWDEKIATGVTEAVEWAKTLEPTTDYEHNISIIARHGYCAPRFKGYAASIVPVYRRELERRLLAERTANSSYLGEVGSRLDVEITVTKIVTWDTQYGTTYLYSMIDDAGNVIIWKASSRQDMDQGSRYLVAGTVKRHNNYNGTKQTVLTRCGVHAPGTTLPKGRARKNKG